jgi:alpha-mannosidase
VPVDVREADDGSILADDLELVLLDEPDVGDLYTFCFAAEGQVEWGPAEIHVDAGTVRAWFDDALEVRMRITHRNDEAFLRLDGVIANGRPDHRLRLHVRLPRPAVTAAAGSPFELVKRPLVSEGSDLEAASATWPARGTVMASGTAIFHEGVFEYEVVDGSALAVTLMRCVGTISRDALATRPFPAGPDVPTPLAQMVGETGFSVGIWPDATEHGLLPNWERFALPIVSATAIGGGSSLATGTLLQVSGGVELSSVRRREGGVEVRLWNPRRDTAITGAVDGREIELGPARIATIPVSSR